VARSITCNCAIWVMPSRASVAANALPTPQISVTGWAARKLRASAWPMTEKPRGLLRSEAILARNLQ
jgi:hypothetical protein